MNKNTLEPTEYNITLRIGCHLVYEAIGPATLLLNIQPLEEKNHIVISESLNLGDKDQKLDKYSDSHGNHVYRLNLKQGTNVIHHDAIVAVSSQPDNYNFVEHEPETIDELPPELLRYTLPSRYCDSDRLTDFAWEKFGNIPHGIPRVNAISEWLHNNIAYVYSSGRPDLTAGDILARGYGVCRDFAHLAIALNRCFNLPARYVTAHMPDIGFPDEIGHMDFHAYAEVFIGGQWYISDPRFHVPRIGRVKIATGLDAVEGAFSTIYGGASLSHFEIWTYQIQRGSVNIGDPIDLAKRLDNKTTIEI